MASGDILSDFGINLLEEEIDDVIFQTNEFLTDATFTGSQGPFWWLRPASPFLRPQLVVVQWLVIYCFARQIPNGTKTGQNHRKIKQRPFLTVTPHRGASSCHVQRYEFVPSKAINFSYFSHPQSIFRMPLSRRITQMTFIHRVVLSLMWMCRRTLHNRTADWQIG